MANSFFADKIRAQMFFVFLWICTACMCTVSPAYAATATSLDSGTSGGCVWKYEEIGGDIVLTIVPANGIEGTLDSFSWGGSQTKRRTKRIVVKERVKVRSSACSMFKGFEQVKSIDISGLDMTDATNMKEMFSACKALTSLKVKGWDVSNVIDMDSVFKGCAALTELDVKEWDVSSVTDMESLFEGCSALSVLNVEDWNVSSVTDMDSLFKNCAALTTLNVNAWKVSSVRDMESMFEGCAALTVLDLDGWNVSGVTDMGSMFKNCAALTALGMNGWNVSGVTDMESMFEGCVSLIALDMSSWSVSNKTLMKDIFANTRSLKEIFFGSNFRINGDAKFENVGSSIGTKWMQINPNKGGTSRNPKGAAFESFHSVVAFHHTSRETKAGTETYIRVAPARLTVSFDKGASDATGEMASQIYGIGAVKKLAKNAYKRAGHLFSGWKDSDGNTYTDRQFIENNYLGKVFLNGEVLPRTLELVAQWVKATTLTYELKEGAGAVLFLSRDKEEFPLGRDPLGSEAAVRGGIPEGKEIRWTVKAGGNGKSWSYKGAKLEKDKIREAAQKDGRLVPTTFVAELVDKTYTVTFDANAPSGTKVEGLPDPIVVKPGESTRVLRSVALNCPGYEFKGEWCDDKNGEGAFYRDASKIKQVSSNMTLYAQWEETGMGRSALNLISSCFKWGGDLLLSAFHAARRSRPGLL